MIIERKHFEFIDWGIDGDFCDSDDVEELEEMLEQCTYRCKLQKDLIYELECKVKKLELKNK